MKHLIICREYPPAPSGGIGTYALHISQLLAEAGETVHVIGQMWEGAEARVEEMCNGRLIIHRVPFESWALWPPHQPHPGLGSEVERGLFKSNYPPQCFSWQASLLAEELVEREGIDVIEAQDYEAPLYYFQLRRALGKGPKSQPPCLVHLHSPTEFIARHNDWDLSLPSVVTAKRLEDYSIAAADALLCPSNYLARQAEAHYGLESGSINVIPLPISDGEMLERGKDVWEQGTICYTGRLERRKGVIEWIEAAVEIAPAYPDARFEFVGDNVLGTKKMSAREVVERLIPKWLRSRFLFRGEQNRSSLSRFLSRARIGVVPSRWENFPNTCVEAMCSGLPVIATRNGGMAEMIEDGRTGWLAAEASSGSLAEALKRALETPPARIAEMGNEASTAIRRMCDNGKIVESHLAFRSRLINQGARRSIHLPVNLPLAKRSFSDETARRKAHNKSGGGIAVVVSCRQGQSLRACLRDLERQTQTPEALVIVNDGSVRKQALDEIRGKGWAIIDRLNCEAAANKNAAIENVLGSGADPVGFVFLDADHRLEPDFIAECEATLRRRPEVGLVSFWTRPDGGDGNLSVSPCPAFPYQWVANEAAAFSAVRTEGLREVGNFRAIMNEGYEDWDLFNALMAAGWAAVTIPAVLGQCKNRRDLMRRSAFDHVPGRMRENLLVRFPDLVARDAVDIVMLAEAHAFYSFQDDKYEARKRIVLARKAVRNPRKAALLVLGKIKKAVYRTRMRVFNMVNS